jgi:hypothetical protein
MTARDLNGAVLWMLAGALCLFGAGLLAAVSTWDRAATDRAYVDASARAVRVEQGGAAGDAAPVRLWVPEENAVADQRLWLQQMQLNQRRIQPKGRS